MDWISKELLLAVIFSLSVALIAVVLGPPLPKLEQTPHVQSQSEPGNSSEQQSKGADATIIEKGRKQQDNHRSDEAFEIPYIGIRTGEGLLVLFTLLLWWSTRALVKNLEKRLSFN